jgi:hypothetical protein
MKVVTCPSSALYVDVERCSTYFLCVGVGVSTPAALLCIINASQFLTSQPLPLALISKLEVFSHAGCGHSD